MFKIPCAYPQSPDLGGPCRGKARQSPNKRWKFNYDRHYRHQHHHPHPRYHRHHHHDYYNYLDSIMSHASSQRFPHDHGKPVNINPAERLKARHVHPAIWISYNICQVANSNVIRFLLTSCQGSPEPCISWFQPSDFAGYSSLPLPEWKLNYRFFLSKISQISCQLSNFQNCTKLTWVCVTASPKSAMTQVPSPRTSTFLDLMSRCAMAGFPCNTKALNMVWFGMHFVGVYIVMVS